MASLDDFSRPKKNNLFQLEHGILSAMNTPLLTQIPNNVTFKPFSSVCKSTASPLPLLRRVHSHSSNGGFLGFSHSKPSDRLTNSLGKFTDTNFLSIFRFKLWWSTQWTGKSSSDIQPETQWIMLDIKNSYVVIIPIIEGSFRSALLPGTDGHMLISAESGSSRVKMSSFDSIAYVHVCKNPYTLMKEAYAAIRVHLNTFKLMEEKLPPSLANKFGWCTWDAFYLTVEPAGIWRGLKEFSDGGILTRFLIIDDGWQSVCYDRQGKNEDAKNLVLGGNHVSTRLHRVDECEKFRIYESGSMLGDNNLVFDPRKPKMLISKALEIEVAEKNRETVSQIEKLKKELDVMFGVLEDKEEENGSGESFGMKAFTRDLRRSFKGLDDIYVWHALVGTWGGVRPNATHLDSKIVACKLSPGLDGTMTDLVVEKLLEGSVGLVHPDQAGDLFDSMHSYLSTAGIEKCMLYSCKSADSMPLTLTGLCGKTMWSNGPNAQNHMPCGLHGGRYHSHLPYNR